MGNFICFARPKIIQKSFAAGIYGNFGSRPTNQLWSILRDLIAIKPGDTIFFYETGAKVFHGVFEATSEPFFCNDDLFGDSQDNYPFRIHFRRKLNFPKNIPSFEFIHLVDRKVVWSLAALEKDPTGPYRSIVNISNQEANALVEVFNKYNTDYDALDGISPASQVVLTEHVEAVDIISKKLWPSVSSIIDFNVLPVGGTKKFPTCAYEFALQAFLAYQLSRKTTLAKEIMGMYAESLTEVPLSAAEPRRIDVLCTYQHATRQQPFFYKVVELKPKELYPLARLGQLLGYLRIFSQKKGVEFGDVGGSIIAPDFAPETLAYIKERAKIEVEKPVQLIKYQLNQGGKVIFNIII